MTAKFPIASPAERHCRQFGQQQIDLELYVTVVLIFLQSYPPQYFFFFPGVVLVQLLIAAWSLFSPFPLFALWKYDGIWWFTFSHWGGGGQCSSGETKIRIRCFKVKETKFLLRTSQLSHPKIIHIYLMVAYSWQQISQA